MSVNENAAEILEKAADGFESGRYSWTRGASYRKDSAGNQFHCAVGAMWKEAGLGNNMENNTLYTARVQSYWAADKALQEAIGLPPAGVPCWNDNVAEDMTEVINAMKEAAKNLRNEGEVK